MSPNLGASMFNRGENLSTRRPLLPDEIGGRYAAVAAAALPGDRPRLPTGAPPPPPRPRLRDPFDGHLHVRQPDSFGSPPIDVRYPRSGSGSNEKVTYFSERPALGRDCDGSLDRRQAELVFRFDPHSSSERLGVAPPAPAAGAAAGQAPTRRGPPDKDGPFVFGVHSPSQFRIPSRFPDDADYDYASVDDAAADTVIRGEHKCCDGVNDWNARGRAKSMRVLNRMFQIKGRRCKGAGRGKKERIKCVLVGDGAVGKTSLITAYAQNKFRAEYEPTAYDTFNVMVEVDDRPICVEICDTAGQDSMSELRALCYPGTDVLMLCFSVVRPETFRAAAARWVRAAATVRAPVVLVGTQADLARDPHVLAELRLRGERVVSEAEARALAASVGAEYVETSARMRTNLKDAFDCAILAGLPLRPAAKRPFWKKLFCVT